jgi:hypothetical protein
MRRTLTITVALVVALASLGLPLKSVAAIGGSGVASATEAPWSVHVKMSDGGSEAAACSGSIIDSTRILTAGHCITNEKSLPWNRYDVRAGITSLRPTGVPQEQLREVVSIRTHPFYTTNTFVQDVALLEVSPPFNFSTPYVQPIGVSAFGAGPFSMVRFFGWGNIAPETFSFDEHRLDLKQLQQWQCPAEWQGFPSFSCFRSERGAPCSGDSGAGVAGGDPSRLFATISISLCAPGAIIGGTDLRSPEIHDWLMGAEVPPRAPEARTYPLLRGRARVGATIHCEAGAWTGMPRLRTAFVEPDRHRVLQRGRSTEFEIPRGSLRRKIACVSIASNAGGRTEIRSSNERRVKGAARAPQ